MDKKFAEECKQIVPDQSDLGLFSLHMHFLSEDISS